MRQTPMHTRHSCFKQKATRAESAKALVSKANSDNKVKKTQVKTGKGRGRGRGRGKAAKEISDDQPQEVAVRDDNAGDKPVPDDIDVSHPGEAIDGEKSDEENGGGDDGKKDKKTYKRKVFTPDELDAMWKQRVPCPQLATYYFFFGNASLHKTSCLPTHANSTSLGHCTTHCQNSG